MAELVAFSQYKLGGVQNFYHNLLSKAPAGQFEIRWIFEDVQDGDPPLPQLYGIGEEIVFKLSVKEGETAYEMAQRLQALISNKPGAVLANFPTELITLHLYRRSKKTIFYICHDEGYVPIAKRFEFIIDVFIAHNSAFYDALVKEMPHREKDIHYIPYGVQVPAQLPAKTPSDALRIVIAARLVRLKGVYDIPVIDTMLKQHEVNVNWTIIGDGPEKESLQSMLLPRGNFTFYSPDTTAEVLRIMQQHDIFILPSRLDGLPVALLEAMSVGCVPVISAFNDGIHKVVTNDIGYVLDIEKIELFANAIMHLHNNREELAIRSERAFKKVKEEFNGSVQSAKYFDLFGRYSELKKSVRRKIPNYGGLLDHPVFPKVFTRVVRNLKTVLNGGSKNIAGQ